MSMGVHGRHVHVVRHGECGMGACLLFVVVSGTIVGGRRRAAGMSSVI